MVSTDKLIIDLEDLCVLKQSINNEHFITNTILQLGYRSELLTNIPFFKNNKETLFDEMRKFNTITTESYNLGMEGIVSSIKEKFKAIYNRLFGTVDDIKEQTEKLENEVDSIKNVDDSEIDYDKPVKKMLSWKKIMFIVLGCVAIAATIGLMVKMFSSGESQDKITNTFKKESSKFGLGNFLNFKKSGTPDFDKTGYRDSINKEAESNAGKTAKQLGYKKGFMKQIAVKLGGCFVFLGKVPSLLFSRIKSLFVSKAQTAAFSAVGSAITSKFSKNKESSVYDVIESSYEINDFKEAVMQAHDDIIKNGNVVSEYNKLIRAIVNSKVPSKIKVTALNVIITSMRKAKLDVKVVSDIISKLKEKSLNESRESYRNTIIDNIYPSFESYQDNDYDYTKDGEQKESIFEKLKKSKIVMSICMVLLVIFAGVLQCILDSKYPSYGTRVIFI